jgi:hypothetical protein
MKFALLFSNLFPLPPRRQDTKKDVSEILQLLENTGLLMATCSCHRNGRMECWNAGILGIKAEINHFNCKKLLQTHHSITPSFHYSNWGEAPKFILWVFVTLWQIFFSSGLSRLRFFYYGFHPGDFSLDLLHLLGIFELTNFVLKA